MRTHGLRWRVLIVVTAFVGFLAALLTRRWLDAGNFLPPVPWGTIALLVGLGGLVLWFGYAVRRYQRGERADLDPIRASRTLALGQAAAVTGAGLIGLYVGQALALAPDADLRAFQPVLWRLLLGSAGGGWLLVSGMVAQSWCRIPPREGQ